MVETSTTAYKVMWRCSCDDVVERLNCWIRIYSAYRRWMMRKEWIFYDMLEENMR